MYDNGQVLGAGTTAGVSVAALPLTSGNTLFQALLITTLIVALAILVVRFIKIVSSKQTR